MFYRDDVTLERIKNKTTMKLLADGKTEAVTKVAELTRENKILEQKLIDLKHKEDLARRDLEAYILNKYKTIPKIVAKEVADKIVKIAKERGVPFLVMVGVAEIESQFKPWLISKKDARGIMQVMPFWVKKKADLGLENMDVTNKYDLHDIETNIIFGVEVFKYHLKEANNDINQALYLYVGKDKTYANSVFNAMGRFEVFRSTLDTTLRAEEDQDDSEGSKETPAGTDKEKEPTT